MTGRIVYEPTDEHRCDVEIRYELNSLGTLSFDHPAYWATPGTVLQCDCGRTFVALSPSGGRMFPLWREEGRWARRRRERRNPTIPVSHDSEPLCVLPTPVFVTGCGDLDNLETE